MAKQKQAEFARWMGPLLDALRKLGGSGTPQEVSEAIADHFKLPDEKREELTPSGIPRFHNQVCWARQYLVWEGYLESSKRGVWQLSSIGTKKHIDDEEARKISIKWVDIHAKKRKEQEQQQDSRKPTAPVSEEVYDDIVQKSDSYKEELISILRSLTPRGFEELCLLLLRENGFENLKLTERGRDGGIDGISTLRINPFVSFKVLFQCKRYNRKNPIKREQIGDFRTSLRKAYQEEVLNWVVTSMEFEREPVDISRLKELLEKEKRHPADRFNPLF